MRTLDFYDKYAFKNIVFRSEKPKSYYKNLGKDSLYQLVFINDMKSIKSHEVYDYLSMHFYQAVNNYISYRDWRERMLNLVFPFFIYQLDSASRAEACRFFKEKDKANFSKRDFDIMILDYKRWGNEKLYLTQVLWLYHFFYKEVNYIQDDTYEKEDPIKFASKYGYSSEKITKTSLLDSFNNKWAERYMLDLHLRYAPKFKTNILERLLFEQKEEIGIKALNNRRETISIPTIPPDALTEFRTERTKKGLEEILRDNQKK